MSSDASRQQVSQSSSSFGNGSGSNSLYKSSSASRMVYSGGVTLPFVSIDGEQQRRARPTTSNTTHSVRVIDQTSNNSNNNNNNNSSNRSSLGPISTSPTSSVVSPIFSASFGAGGAQHRTSADPVKFFSSSTRSRCIDTTSLLFGNNANSNSAAAVPTTSVKSTSKGGPCIQIPVEMAKKPQPSSAWTSNCVGASINNNSNSNVASASSAASSNNSTLDKYLYQSTNAGVSSGQQQQQKATAGSSSSHNSSFNYNDYNSGSRTTSSTPVHTDFGGVGGDAYNNFSSRNSTTASNNNNNNNNNSNNSQQVDNQSAGSKSASASAKSSASHIETINQIARDLIALQQTEAQQQQQPPQPTQHVSSSSTTTTTSEAAKTAAAAEKATSSTNFAVSAGGSATGAAVVAAVSASSAASSAASATLASASQQQQKCSDHSEILKRMLGTDNPIDVPECEQVCAAGVRGIYANKAEATAQWTGEQPLEAYELNTDMASAQVVRKKPSQTLHYTQDVNVRYLKPPQPAPPGDLIIRQEPDRQLPAAPPLVIRQTPARPKTPEPIVLRERPPKAPQPVPTQVITVPGKVLPAPARRIVVEKLPELPARPQPVIIERWLPYEKQERRIVYEKAPAPPADPCCRAQPTNLIIEWQTPDVECERELTHLGVFETDPCEYERQHAASLMDRSQLPAFVLDIQPPSGVRLAAADTSSSSSSTSSAAYTSSYAHHHASAAATTGDNLGYDLVGDLDALRLVDLHKEGLDSYRSYLVKRGVLAENQAQLGSQVNFSSSNNNNGSNSSNRSATQLVSQLESANSSTTYHSMSSSASSSSTTTTTFGKPCTASAEATEAAKNGDKSEATLLGLIEEIFKSIDKTRSGFIHVDDAERVLLRLSSRFGRRYRDEDVYSLFRKMSSENSTCISLAEFQRAFLNLNF